MTLLGLQSGLTASYSGVMLASLAPSAAMRLLGDVFTQDVNAEQQKTLLKEVLRHYEHYTSQATQSMAVQVARFDGPRAFIKKSLKWRRDALRPQALALLVSPSKKFLRYPLIDHAEQLAKMVGLETRAQELSQAPASRNPVPWWYHSRITTEHGALAVGGIHALDWLMAMRSAHEREEVPGSFSREPYLLWIPDELYQAVYLNKTGCVFPVKGKEPIVVNEPGQIQIKALGPLLRDQDAIVVNQREDTRFSRLMEKYGEKPHFLQVILKQKYRTYRGIKAFEDGWLTLSDGERKHLKAEESLYFPTHGEISRLQRWSLMTYWAIEKFQNLVLDGKSLVLEELLRIPSLQEFRNRFIIYDYQGLNTGAMPLLGLWQALKDNQEVRFFFRDERPRMGSGGRLSGRGGQQETRWMAKMENGFPRKTTQAPPPEIDSYLESVLRDLRQIQEARRRGLEEEASSAAKKQDKKPPTEQELLSQSTRFPTGRKKPLTTQQKLAETVDDIEVPPLASPRVGSGTQEFASQALGKQKLERAATLPDMEQRPQSGETLPYMDTLESPAHPGPRAKQRVTVEKTRSGRTRLFIRESSDSLEAQTTRVQLIRLRDRCQAHLESMREQIARREAKGLPVAASTRAAVKEMEERLADLNKRLQD